MLKLPTTDRHQYLKLLGFKTAASAMASSSRWWSSDTLAVVTGANKGIGLEIVRQLAKQGISVVLTSRDAQRGLAARQKLQSEGLHVQFHQLDVKSQDSVNALGIWLKEQHEGFDILVNNAAVAGNDYGYEAAKHVMDTNYEGVKKTTKTLLPLLRSSQAGARVINISSELGQLKRLNIESYKKQLTDIENLSEATIDEFVHDYLSDVKEGKEESKGWPGGIFGAYKVSKMALNAYTRLVARQVQNRNERDKIYVNCVHPGYVRTDLNNNRGILSTEEGADTGVWLALAPPGGGSGEYFFQRKKHAF